MQPLKRSIEIEYSSDISYLSAKPASLVIRAVNNKTRQLILSAFLGIKEISVTELYLKLNLQQAVVSQHLAILKKARLVKTQREGNSIFYSLDKERLLFIQSICEKLSK